MVMTGDGGLVEVQATAERTPLSRASLDELLALGAAGIERLRAAQQQAVGGGRRRPEAGAVRLVLATRNAHKLRELAPLLAPHELEPLPDDVELPPETGDDLRGQRARQGARGGGGHRRCRRSPTTRGSRPPRSAARPGCARRATPARARATRRTSPSCCARCRRRRRARGLRVRARLRGAGRRGARGRGALRGRAHARAARRRAASATTRPSCPPTCDDGRTMAELSPTRRTRSATAAAPRGR